MSGLQGLKVFINQRLTAAVEEIFGHLEKTITEYEEEMDRRRCTLLDVFFKPEIRLRREDVQHLLMRQKHQEDPPEPPHIKEEQEELWTSQEGEQLRGLEEADITEFPFTPVPVKRDEDDEEKPQSSQLHQSQPEENRHAEHLKTEADGEDCGGPEPARNSDPDHHLQPAARASHFSEAETDDDSCDWEETREPQSGLNSLQNNKMPLRDEECNTGKKSSRSSESAPSFGHKGRLQKHYGFQTRVKPFSCSVCGRRYSRKTSLTAHVRLHSEGKRFGCSVCKASFGVRDSLVNHMRIHTGEKPFSCSVCGRRFTQKGHLKQHLTVHTGEKPYSCSVCGKGFALMGTLRRHWTVHTGERPFSCSVCGKRFGQRGHLRQHFTVHTGEKRFNCRVCGKGFSQFYHYKRHKCAGESIRNK